MTTTPPKEAMSPSELISNQIAGLADWRGALLARIRELIKAAAPDITEEWKWDTAVWSQIGNVVSSAPFKDHINLNFFQRASLEDSHRLFNAGLEAKATRAIDFFEGDKIQEAALKDLIRAAVANNLSGGKKN